MLPEWHHVCVRFVGLCIEYVRRCLAVGLVYGPACFGAPGLLEMLGLEGD